MPTGKRPTEEIADYMGKVTFLPNSSYLFSARTFSIGNFDLNFKKLLYCNF